MISHVSERGRHLRRNLHAITPFTHFTYVEKFDERRRFQLRRALRRFLHVYAFYRILRILPNFTPFTKVGKFDERHRSAIRRVDVFYQILRLEHQERLPCTKRLYMINNMQYNQYILPQSTKVGGSAYQTVLAGS